MLELRKGKRRQGIPLLPLPRRTGGGDSTPPDYPEEIPTYLVPAILVTMFCCLPLGIPAIAFAAIASNHLASGNKAAAITASNSAKTWCGISFFCGLALIALFSVAVCSGLVPRRFF